MKINIKLFIGILAIGLIGITACKKKKDESPKAKLSGKWKLTQIGTDANNNSIMEASEVETLPDTFVVYMTFNGDGNGSVSTDLFGSTLSTGFTWTLINNDADINVKAAPGSSSFFTVTEGTVHIHTLSFTDLVTRDTSSMSGTLTHNWSVFKKQ